MLLMHLHFLVVFVLVAPEAYIDPNTGGMLFQILAVLLAALSGILFFFSRQIKAGWARLRRNFRKENRLKSQARNQVRSRLNKGIYPARCR
jgi:hypothetical protein